MNANPATPDKDPDLSDDVQGFYRRGYTAGYQARVRQEVAAYFEAIRAGQQVYDRVIKGLVDTPTYLERKAARVAVLREGHAAELHVGQPVLDCPVCQEATRVVVGRWHGSHCVAPGHVHTGIEANRYGDGCDVVLDSYLPVGKPHSGHYGAPDYNGPGYPCEGAEMGVCGGGPVHDEACSHNHRCAPDDYRCRSGGTCTAPRNPAYGVPRSCRCASGPEDHRWDPEMCPPMRTIEHECLIKDGRCLVKGHDV